MRSEQTQRYLSAQITALEQRFDHAAPDQRAYLQTDVQRMISCLIAKGETVPTRLRQLNRRVEEAAFDDTFENMPV